MTTNWQTSNQESQHIPHQTYSAPWKRFQERLLMPDKNTTYAQGHYDLLSVLCQETGAPKIFFSDWAPKGFYIALTDPSYSNAENSASNIRSFMLGKLIEIIRQNYTPMPIVINPNHIPLDHNVSNVPSDFKFEEVLWSALRAPLTGKLMTSPPEEALALLAIDQKDQERFGINFVFHMISNLSAPEAGEEREIYLKEKIRELAHFIPRVPIGFGSASIYCILLNLDNAMEETAFIRDYQTFDPYSDVLFVTSSLELLTGKLRPIKIQGEQIDTIFGPIIEWQRHHNPLRSQWHNLCSQLSSLQH